MTRLLTIFTAALVGLAVMGFSEASADDRRRHNDRRVECDSKYEDRRDRRDCYENRSRDRDRRGRRHRDRDVNVTIDLGRDRYYADRRYRNDRRYRDDRRYYNDRRYNDRRGRRGSRIIRRQSFDTRGRARIRLVEEEIYRRGRNRRICTVTVTGPDRRRVPYRRLQNIADRYCSRRAEIRIF
ncbi:MAG: hypothetical protein AAFY84_03835 [Pseudomonadota bacterium]